MGGKIDEVLRRMEGRKGPRLVVSVHVPSELQKALKDSNRGRVDSALHVRLEPEKHKEFLRLAKETHVSAASLVRLLVDASLTLGLPGVRSFVNRANKVRGQK